MTEPPAPPRDSGRSVDVAAMHRIARELSMASQVLFDAARSVQRHTPDAGEPPAGDRVSDLQAAAVDALRSLAGGLDAAAARMRAGAAR